MFYTNKTANVLKKFTYCFFGGYATTASTKNLTGSSKSRVSANRKLPPAPETRKYLLRLLRGYEALLSACQRFTLRTQLPQRPTATRTGILSRKKDSEFRCQLGSSVAPVLRRFRRVAAQLHVSANRLTPHCSKSAAEERSQTEAN